MSGEVRSRTDLFDGVVRLALDLKYASERDQLKQVLRSDSGWEYCIRRWTAEVEPAVLLDLFTNEYDAEKVLTNGALHQPEQYLGLRLTGLDHDQLQAVLKLFSARFVCVNDTTKL